MATSLATDSTVSRVRRGMPASTLPEGAALAWVEASSDDIAIGVFGSTEDIEDAAWEAVIESKRGAITRYVTSLRARIRAGEATPLRIEDF